MSLEENVDLADVQDNDNKPEEKEEEPEESLLY
jgi:hypothetical protein